MTHNYGGDLLVSLVDGNIRVDRADDHIFLMKDLIEELETAGTHPYVTLTADQLEIRAINGTYCYQLGEWGWEKYSNLPGRHAYLIDESVSS